MVELHKQRPLSIVSEDPWDKARDMFYEILKAQSEEDRKKPHLVFLYRDVDRIKCTCNWIPWWERDIGPSSFKETNAWVSEECLWCGDNFIKSRSAPQKYCSRLCSREHEKSKRRKKEKCLTWRTNAGSRLSTKAH